MSIKNDLNSLVVSQEEIASGELTETLKGLVTLIKETGEVMPTVEFSKLDNNKKVLVYFLGLRACTLLGLGSKKTAASAEEIADVIGADVQRTREILSRMKSKLLQKTAEGWQLPMPRTVSACEIVRKK